MLITLRKTLNLGLAALMIASVGASTATQSVSARHIRTHRVYRHRRRNHHNVSRRQRTRIHRNRRHHVNYQKHNRIRHRNHRIRARKSRRQARRHLSRRNTRRHLKIRRIRRRNVRIRGRKTRRHAKRAQKRVAKRVVKTAPQTATQPVNNQTASFNKPQMSASDQTDQIVPMQNSAEINHQTKLFDYFAVQDLNNDREQDGLPALQPSALLNYYAKKLIYPEGDTDLKYAFQGPYDFAGNANDLYIDEWGISKKLPNWGQDTENVLDTKPTPDYYDNNGKSAADIYNNDERNDQLSSYQDANHDNSNNVPANVDNPNFGHIGFAGLYVPDQGYDAVALFSK